MRKIIAFIADTQRERSRLKIAFLGYSAILVAAISYGATAKGAGESSNSAATKIAQLGKPDLRTGPVTRTGPVNRDILQQLTQKFADLVPADLTVSPNSAATFSLVRHKIVGGSQAAPAECSYAARIHPVRVRIVETKDHPSGDAALAAGDVVYDQVWNTGNNCKFTFDTLGFNARPYVGYAWSVVDEADRAIRLDWRRFMLSDTPMQVDFDTEQAAESCWKSSRIADASFLNGGPSIMGATSQLTNWAPQTANLASGDGDAGALSVTDRNSVLVAPLTQAIRRGEKLQLNLSLYAVADSGPLTLRAYAVNGNRLTSLTPGQGSALIGSIDEVPAKVGDWVKFSFDPWVGTGAFSHVALVITKAGNKPLNLKIDQLCIGNVEGSYCGQTQLPPELAKVGKDVRSGGNATFSAESLPSHIKGREAETSINLGSVQSRYPQYDVSTLDWMEQAQKDGLMQCSAIGDGNPKSVEPPAEFDAASEKKSEKDWIEVEALHAEINKEPTDLPSILSKIALRFDPPVPSGCSVEPGGLDPSKPFSGRDIVYVQGLRTSHLTDNYNLKPQFQAKWPEDRSAFFAGGIMHVDAETYWHKHLGRELGNGSTNSYMVIGYTTNQRLIQGIDATLAQIHQAMESGPNSGTLASKQVMWSPKDVSQNRCFGAKGIVIVSHSTGSLLTSSMLGLAALSEQPGHVQNKFGNLSWLNQSVKAHVSFNGAHGGSPIATVGIVAMAISQADNPDVDAFQNMYLEGDGNNQMGSYTPPLQTVLVDLVPEYARQVWQPVMAQAKVPTVNAVSAIPGFSAPCTGDPLSLNCIRENVPNQFGQLLIPGFDDAVLSTSSARAHTAIRPTFIAKNPLKLWDFGNEPLKALGVHLQSKRSTSQDLRNYAVYPHLSPTGMVQSESIAGYVQDPKSFVKNQYVLLQNTGDHYDAAHLIGTRGSDRSDYANTKYGIRNYEETATVLQSDLYTKGLIRPAFAALNEEHMRKKSIGFHLPSISIKRYFKISVRWKYHEIIIWRRHYLLMKDHQTKNAADYVYDNVLR